MIDPPFGPPPQPYENAPVDPRDPDDTRLPPSGAGYSPLRALVAWVVVVTCIGLVLLNLSEKQPPADSEALNRRREMTLNAKQLVFSKSLATPSAAPSTQPLSDMAKTPADRIRVAIVVGEIQGANDALALLADIKRELTATTQPASTEADAFAEEVAASVPPPSAAASRPSTTLTGAPTTGPTNALANASTNASSEDLASMVQVVQQIYIYGANAIDRDSAQQLRDRFGWFGQLALAHDQPPDNPDRKSAIGAARFVVISMSVMVIAIVIGLLAGLVLFILAIVYLCQGSIRFRYAIPRRRTTAFLEGFAMYLCGLTAIQWISPHLPPQLWMFQFVSLFAILIVPICWIKLAGIRWPELCEGFGLHTGSGLFTEIGCGIVGYLAGLPVIILGMAVSLGITWYTGGDSSHPIMHELGQNPILTIILFFEAAIYAPVAEELFFRGALFHHLRQRRHWVPAALLVAAIFAVLHPQGLAAVPALGSIAFVFASIRQWRGSIIGSMAAHSLNNATLVILFTILFS